jgi:hypothetical protein
VDLEPQIALARDSKDHFHPSKIQLHADMGLFDLQQVATLKLTSKETILDELPIIYKLLPTLGCI